jgi:hypothetical protein
MFRKPEEDEMTSYREDEGGEGDGHQAAARWGAKVARN